MSLRFTRDARQKNPSKFVASLKKRLMEAYNLAKAETNKSKAHQKRNFDLRVRGSSLRVGDRVLVKAVAFERKHILAYRWQDPNYIVVAQPNIEIPVLNSGSKGKMAVEILGSSTGTCCFQ